MDFVTEIYTATRNSPREETYCLTSQLRRASISIPSNIAEGQARHSPREFKHFLDHARGSLVEAETQLLIAGNLGYLQKQHTEQLLRRSAELGRILNGLIRSLKPDQQPGPETEN